VLKCFPSHCGGPWLGGKEEGVGRKKEGMRDERKQGGKRKKCRIGGRKGV
jgi:hypothetical protein